MKWVITIFIQLLITYTFSDYYTNNNNINTEGLMEAFTWKLLVNLKFSPKYPENIISTKTSPFGLLAGQFANTFYPISTFC